MFLYEGQLMKIQNKYEQCAYMYCKTVHWVIIISYGTLLTIWYESIGSRNAYLIGA